MSHTQCVVHYSVVHHSAALLLFIGAFEHAMTDMTVIGDARTSTIITNPLNKMMRDVHAMAMPLGH
jgi:hypothetical protein